MTDPRSEPYDDVPLYHCIGVTQKELKSADKRDTAYGLYHQNEVIDYYQEEKKKEEDIATAYHFMPKGFQGSEICPVFPSG